MRQKQSVSYQLHPHPASVHNHSVALQRLPINQHRTIAYPQGYQRLTPSHARPHYHTMAMPPNRGDEVSQELGGDHDSGKPVFTSHPPLVHQQPGYSFPGQSCFFDYCFDYRTEEATLYNPLQSFPAQESAPCSLQTLDQPYSLTTLPASPNNTTASQAVAPRDVPIMPLVQTNVDTTQFEPVESEHWHKASLDFSTGNDDDTFATSSPTCTDSTNFGPFTPHDESGFSEVTWRRLSHDLSSSYDSSGSDMFKAHGPDTCFSSFSDASSGIGPQFGSQASHCGGHPSHRSSFEELRAPSVEVLPLNPRSFPESFRDTDGLPTILPVIAPKPEEYDGSVVSCTASNTTRQCSTEREREANLRDRRDQYLLDRREEGFTYKEIKVMGNFFEAESTLRGRVRVLTKDRSARVRKPVWTESDVGTPLY